MTTTGSLDRFFAERSAPRSLKLPLFLLSLIPFPIFFYLLSSGLVYPAEARLGLYFFYILIFVNTFFCGFVPGIIIAVISSTIAIYILVSYPVDFFSLNITDFEIFPFLAMFFLIAITVDWFKEHIEKLKKQIEENEKLNAQTRHMEKLALAGEIAAGIAHEIRNPLTVIHGYIQLLAKKAEARSVAETEIYTMLLEEVKRSNQIISDFLRFSRPGKPHKTLIQLNETIESAASLLYAEILRNNVDFHSYPDPELPELFLDRDQMMQVFLNLFSNALQAMPNGGSLSVYTSFAKKENMVRVRVSDSGSGITRANLENIFTPFFTTRDEGTGLGLPITHSIIVSHQGQVQVESSPGQGTQFTILFPVQDNCPADSCMKEE